MATVLPELHVTTALLFGGQGSNGRHRAPLIGEGNTHRSSDSQYRPRWDIFRNAHLEVLVKTNY